MGDVYGAKSGLQSRRSHVDARRRPPKEQNANRPPRARDAADAAASTVGTGDKSQQGKAVLPGMAWQIPRYRLY